MTPEHDLIFYPNSPIMEQEVKDDYENFSELDIVKQERAHYQRLYSAEYSKIEAIKDVVNYGRSIESKNGTANIILNKLESIIYENENLNETEKPQLNIGAVSGSLPF